jgi:hypothetical protein
LQSKARKADVTGKAASGKALPGKKTPPSLALKKAIRKKPAPPNPYSKAYIALKRKKPRRRGGGAGEETARSGQETAPPASAKVEGGGVGTRPAVEAVRSSQRRVKKPVWRSSDEVVLPDSNKSEQKKKRPALALAKLADSATGKRLRK